MGRNRNTNICIGLEWPGPAAADFQRSLEAFLAAFPKTPLAWVMTAFPELEKKPAGFDSVVSAVRTRLDAPGDRVIPAGYSGAPHALLTAAEIAREIEWARKNPWRSGITDMFKQESDVLLAPAPDLSRNAADALYAGAGYRWIGLPLPESADVYRFSGPAPSGDCAVFHYYPVARAAGVKLSKIAGSFFPRGLERIFLLARPANEEDLPRLLGLIEELEKRHTLRFTAGDLFTGAGRVASDGARNTPPVLIQEDPLALGRADEPIARNLREKAARLRAKEPEKQTDLREILVLTAGGAEEADKARRNLEPRVVPREGTAYTANMPGEILLPGSSFDAHFSAGRLTDLRENGVSFLTAPGSRGWVRRGSQETPLTFDRIFSFEKNELRGLEAFVLLPGRERAHFFTLRYAFAGDLPWLIVSGEMRSRAADQADAGAVAPLEIPLGEFAEGERLSIRSDYPDGGYRVLELAGDDGAVRLAGSVFSIETHNRRLVFGFVTHKAAPIHLLSLRPVRSRKSWTAWLNPFGAYDPGPARAALSSGEVRTFYLSVRDEIPARPPELPASILKIIPAHQVFRPD